MCKKIIKLHLLSTTFFQQPLPKLGLQAHYNTVLFSFATRKIVTEARSLDQTPGQAWPSTGLFISSNLCQNKEMCFEEIAKENMKGSKFVSPWKPQLKRFCSSLHLKKKTITFGPETYYLRTLVALVEFVSLTHAVFISFGSLFVTFLACKVTGIHVSVLMWVIYSLK